MACSQAEQRARCRERGSSYDGLSARAVGELFSLLSADPRGSSPEVIATHLSAMRVRALPALFCRRSCA